MKIEQIVEEWSKDLQIDQTDLSSESSNIPKLHNKYYLYYVNEGMQLRKMRTDYKKFIKLKTEYYRGELGPEELRQYGWDPQPLKILKTEIQNYVEADDDVIERSLRIGAQEYKVNYIEEIIRQINNRGYQLKTILDFEKFRTGA